MPNAPFRSYGDPCGIARALDLVGERWSLLVVRELLLGPKRFTDLRAGLPGASPDVLAQRLRELEGGGIISAPQTGCSAKRTSPSGAIARWRARSFAPSRARRRRRLGRAGGAAGAAAGDLDARAALADDRPVGPSGENDVAEFALARCAAGDYAGGTEAIVRAWGPGLHAFLYRLAGRDEASAADAYMDACVAILRGLASFDAGRGSLRAWAFAVARNALRMGARAERRHRPGAGSSALERVEAVARSTTAAFRRTDVKERVGRLRAALSADDQALLALRVEERLSWAEIALALGEPGEAPARASARLRKRFERAVGRLRELVQADGLVAGEG